VTLRRVAGALSSALLLVLAGARPVGSGPYDMKLIATPAAPSATGTGRLIFATSPFGIASTADGHAVYNIQVTAAGLPTPSSLGAYKTFIAWAVTPDLNTWTRLGTIANGENTVGPVDLNKFLVVVTAESSPTSTTHDGPTVLHGSSPSAWLQSFISHPMFRGMPP
jgi:hypothetical protein